MPVLFALIYMTYFNVVMPKELSSPEIIHKPNNKILISGTKDQNIYQL